MILSDDSAYSSYRIVPRLLYVSNLKSDDKLYLLLEKKPVEDFSTHTFGKERQSLSDTFRQRLLETTSEIFDESISFVATSDDKICQWCDFKNICGK